MTPLELSRRWREDAEVLATYDERLAAIARRHADELEAALRSADDELLDLTTAARASGLSVDRLRHKVAAGEIANAGRRGSPRVRRGDLPIKKRAVADGFDPAAAAADVLRAGSGQPRLT